MNAIEIIEQAADTLGFERPSSITNPQDLVASRLLGALNRALEEIIRDYDWQTLILKKVFTTTDVEGESGYYTAGDGFSGYDMDDLVPGFDYFISDYIYDITDKRRINSVTFDRNSLDQMYNINTSNPSFIFMQNAISFTPEIPAGHEISFFYKSKWGVYDDTLDDGDSYAFKEYFENDTDLSFLNSQLLLRGLLWKYKFETGGDYSESYRDYEKFLNRLKDQDSTRRTVGGHGFGCNLDIRVDADGKILSTGEL